MATLGDDDDADDDDDDDDDEIQLGTQSALRLTCGHTHVCICTYL